MILSALSSVARARLCRQMASCGFTSARTRIRWCFTCLVCVSVTATRPCRHHCGHRQPKMHMVQEMREVQSANSGPRGTKASWASFRPWRTRAVDQRRLRRFLSVCWTHIARSKKYKNWAQSRHICATLHMTPILKDLDSFAGWSDADVLQVSCGTHRLQKWHQWSFWPSDRWRHVFGSRLHFYALSAIRIRRPLCFLLCQSLP